MIYAPSGELWWAKGYATIPTAEVLNEEVIRIYFASLDENLFGRIGFVDVNAENPTQILFQSREPVLDIGEPGTFDDSGVNASCILNISGKKFLYYIGWQRAERVPYMLFAGLAVSRDDGKSFIKHSRTPILDRTPNEPFLRSTTTVIHESGVFKTWYVSAFDWIEVNSVKYPTYIIKYATSENGIDWQSRDNTCISLKDDEFGFGRPWVIKEKDKYLMWYSIRSKTRPYCIGYAESENGIDWTRKDEEAGIVSSESGWDSEMICYPCVVDAVGKRYLFYNGNRHGSTGFGYAVLEN